MLDACSLSAGTRAGERRGGSQELAQKVRMNERKRCLGHDDDRHQKREKLRLFRLYITRTSRPLQLTGQCII